MDSNTFDSLSRSLAGGSTRRRFSGALAAFGLGSIASLRVLGAAAADAEGKKKGKGKKVAVCRDGQTIRVPKRRLKKHLRQGATRGECVVQPQCVPDCTGPLGAKSCGDDGCGGTCGTCPFVLPICNPITFTCEPIVSIP